MTGIGTSRALAQDKLEITADVINRHKTHYKPPEARTPGTSKRDFAILVRDKAYDQFEAGQLSLVVKDTVPGVTAGLKAQAILDRRDEKKSKAGLADLAWALLGLLKSETAPPLRLEDGNTIEGEFDEAD